MNRAEKLMRARCRLIALEPFYGTFAMRFVWRETDRVPTMGVKFIANGFVECLYNPTFVDSHSLKYLYCVVKHEIEHIIRLHPARGHQKHAPYAWNVACDMCCNGKRSKPKIDLKGWSPDDGVYLPEDWPNNKTAEEYYDMFPTISACVACPNKDNCKSSTEKGNNSGAGGGSSDEEKNNDSDNETDENGDPSDNEAGENGDPSDSGTGEGGDSDNEAGEGGGGDPSDSGAGEGDVVTIASVPEDCPMRKFGSPIDDHGTWEDSACSEDEARQMVKDMVNQASQASQGFTPGHLTDAIDALNVPIVSWRQLTKQWIGRNLGNRRWTFSRRNRRHDRFGVKGCSHHACADLSVIVDTSGSMSTEVDLKQAFTEIEEVSHKMKVGVLQWDAGFKRYDKYRRGDWKKIEIAGRGGTSNFDDALQWLVDNDKLGNACVFITDGVMRQEDFPQREIVPMVFIITTNQPGPEWVGPGSKSVIVHLDTAK